MVSGYPHNILGNDPWIFSNYADAMILDLLSIFRGNDPGSSLNTQRQ
jgi:hypothetical protein